MLKIRVWDREQMHEADYAGPKEFYAKNCFIDFNGFFVFMDQHQDKQTFNPDFYMIDVFSE